MGVVNASECAEPELVFCPVPTTRPAIAVKVSVVATLFAALAGATPNTAYTASWTRLSKLECTVS